MWLYTTWACIRDKAGHIDPGRELQTHQILAKQQAGIKQVLGRECSHCPTPVFGCADLVTHIWSQY